jgi:hypothetical protein
MKRNFTLTKIFSLAILLVSFTVASASSGEDDTCKTKCCKSKQAKSISVSVADLDKALEELDAEISYVTAVAISKEVKRSLRTLRFKKVTVTTETPAVFFAFNAEENNVDAKQKINFNALDKEMSQVQEDLSKMDDCLKNDDAKNRKAAEVILKTGIKS